MQRFFNSGRPTLPAAERRRRPRARIAAVTVALALLGLVPAQVSASHLDSSLSVSIANPIKLINGVYLAVQVQIACPTLEAPLTAIFSDGLDINVTEKTGKSLAVGSGSFGYQSPVLNGVTFGTPVICDGTAHLYTVNVFPTFPLSGPFHGGPAVASGDFDLGVYDPTSCVFCTLDDNFIRFGPQSISLR